MAAGPGSRFVAVAFTVINRSEKQSLWNYPHVVVIGSDNQAYQANAAVPECTYFPNGGDLMPGQSATGCFGYQLDDPVKVAEVKWTTDDGYGNSGLWRQLPPPTATVPGVPIPCQDQSADGEVFVCGPTATTGYVLKGPAPGTAGIDASGPPGGASSPASAVLGLFNDYLTGQWAASCSYYPPGTTRQDCLTGATKEEQKPLQVTGTMQVVRVVTFGSLALVATTGDWCTTTKFTVAHQPPPYCSENTNPNEAMPVGGPSLLKLYRCLGESGRRTF